MKRLTFDKIVTAVGFGPTALLLVTAGLLNWGSNFASDAVSSQLIAQEIAMPTYAAASNNSRTAAAALAADSGNAVLISDAASKSATVETVFKGTMLRGTLLTAYAFATLVAVVGYRVPHAIVDARK
ncbi:MAG: hypothetical protein QNL07_04930 [Candidatus Planktophila sp.]